MKTLVLFHSMTGKTRTVAEVLATELKADLAALVPVKKQPLPITFFLGGFRSTFGLAVAIKPLDKQIADYDRVLIGGPVWSWSPNPVLNAVLRDPHLSGKTVVPFFTMAGDSADRARRKAEARARKQNAAVPGSFAISSSNKSEAELRAAAKKAVTDADYL